MRKKLLTVGLMAGFCILSAALSAHADDTVYVGRPYYLYGPYYPPTAPYPYEPENPALQNPPVVGNPYYPNYRGYPILNTRENARTLILPTNPPPNPIDSGD